MFSAQWKELLKTRSVGRQLNLPHRIANRKKLPTKEKSTWWTVRHMEDEHFSYSATALLQVNQ